MKTYILAFISLVTINLNAQKMENPKDVVHQLFIATDNRDWSSVMDCFAAEVRLDYSSMTGTEAVTLSPTAIVDSWKKILPGFKSTHHQIGNMMSKESLESAEVFCYGTASHYLENGKGNLWIVVGSYDFNLIKDEGNRWKISGMKFNYKYQDGNTELPVLAQNLLK